jgi:hypothetical protein
MRNWCNWMLYAIKWKKEIHKIKIIQMGLNPHKTIHADYGTIYNF